MELFWRSLLLARSDTAEGSTVCGPTRDPRRSWTPWGARSAMYAHPCAAAQHSSRNRDGDHHRSSERCWRL
eukprot:6493937-Prymnesium_polylepis.1